MTLHLGLPHAHTRNAEQQHEVREARRLLKERVRDDWDYPPLPAFQTPHTPTTTRTNDDADSDRIAGFKFHHPAQHPQPDTYALDFEPAEWRERDYSSEEDAEEAEAEVKAEKQQPRKASGSSNSDHHRPKKLGNIFKFEGPESVGPQIEERKAAKRRKRQRALDEESEWNDGLKHWLGRRDAWCCARTTAEVRGTREEGAESGSVALSPRTSTSTASAASAASTSTASTPAPGSSNSPSTTPDLVAPPSSPPTTNTASTATSPPQPPSEILIPLAPPLLPHHPIRKRITPTLYPEIYSKIIVGGRTPSVPINLLTLTRALVQGWKEDGEWPPKASAAAVEPLAGRRRGKSGGGLVGKVGRVLRITGTGEGGGGGREKG